jgi:uncharacterized membrane protein
MQNLRAKRIFFAALAPQPNGQWRGYALRWLIGGCWSLWQLPLRGLAYGAVFFAVAYSWRRALTDFTGGSLALAVTLTGVTLLLAPRLTADLVAGMSRHAVLAEDDEARRQGALVGVGSLLVMILSLALNSAMVCFALLYNGDVPALDGLLPAVFSWRNLPLALLLPGLVFVAGLSLQLAAVLPTYVLMRESETDLFTAVRSSAAAAYLNWRPLAWWALTSQLALLVGVSVLPISLVLLAPVIACGSWWACRDMSFRDRASGL